MKIVNFKQIGSRCEVRAVWRANLGMSSARVRFPAFSLCRSLSLSAQSKQTPPLFRHLRFAFVSVVTKHPLLRSKNEGNNTQHAKFEMPYGVIVTLCTVSKRGTLCAHLSFKFRPLLSIRAQLRLTDTQQILHTFGFRSLKLYHEANRGPKSRSFLAPVFTHVEGPVRRPQGGVLHLYPSSFGSPRYPNTTNTSKMSVECFGIRSEDKQISRHKESVSYRSGGSLGLLLARILAVHGLNACILLSHDRSLSTQQKTWSNKSDTSRQTHFPRFLSPSSATNNNASKNIPITLSIARKGRAG